MLFRKTILFFSIVAVSSLTSCTTRYQDMLRERDEQIRSLTGANAQLHNENEELLRTRSAAPAEASAQPKAETPKTSEKDDLQVLVGSDASVDYIHNKLTIGVNDAIAFDSGSAALKDSAHKVLQNVANALHKQYSGRRIYVEGHTDTDPIKKSKFEDNMDLSLKRAKAVGDYLKSHGVPENSIVVLGYGQYEPLTSAKNKSQNRRVQIVIGERL